MNQPRSRNSIAHVMKFMSFAFLVVSFGNQPTSTFTLPKIYTFCLRRNYLSSLNTFSRFDHRNPSPSFFSSLFPNMATSASQDFKNELPILRGILFDIDGTLFHSDPVHFEVFKNLFLEMGFNAAKPIDEDFFRKKIAGRQNALICADLFPEWSVEKAEEWSAFKEAKFREAAIGKLEPLPGLEDLMHWIDNNEIKKAAVTNAPRANAEFMLDVINRRPWFTVLIIGDECERAKPDPLPYKLAMRQLGLQPEETIVFEDSPSGAAAGVASGAFTVGVLSTQTEEVLREAGCHMVVRDFRDPALWRLLRHAAPAPAPRA